MTRSDSSAILKLLDRAKDNSSGAKAIIRAFRYLEEYPDTAAQIVYALSEHCRSLYNILCDELTRPDISSSYRARLEQLGTLSGFFKEMEQFLDGPDKRLVVHLIGVLKNIRSETAENLLVKVFMEDWRPVSVRAQALESLSKRDNIPNLDSVYELIEDQESPLGRAALSYIMELIQFKPNDVFAHLSSMDNKRIRYVLDKVKLPSFPENLRLLLNIIVSGNVGDMRTQNMVKEIIGRLVSADELSNSEIGRKQLVAADLLGRHLRSVVSTPIRVFLLRMILKLGNIGITVLNDHVGQARLELKQELSDIFMRFPTGKSIELLEMVMESLDEKQALKAISHLKQIGSLQSLELLIKLLCHDTKKVRKAAQMAITGLINVNQISMFLSSPEPSVRITMLEIIKLHANHKTTRELVTPLLVDQEPAVRKKALETLSYLGKERDPLPFLKAAGDPDQGVQQYALEILKSIQTIYGNKALADHMSHPDKKIAGVAARVIALKAWNDFEKYALSQCDSAGDLFAKAMEIDAGVRKHLVMGITNSDHKIRFTSAKILAAISEQSYLEEIIRPLVLRAMADPHPHVRATAIKAFRNLGHVRDSAKLIKLLNDADERVRANVVETLSRFWNKKTKKAIRHMANDPSPRVKANTAIIMAKRGTKEGLKLIRKLLNSEDPALKIAGNYALQAVGGRLR